MCEPALAGGIFCIRKVSHFACLDSFAKRLLFSRLAQTTNLQALSSGVEHYLDTVGVSGSNPLEPMISPGLSGRFSLAHAKTFNVSS